MTVAFTIPQLRVDSSGRLPTSVASNPLFIFHTKLIVDSAGVSSRVSGLRVALSLTPNTVHELTTDN